jgi:hypothetical protein
VSEKLLKPDQTFQAQFIGAQSLYQKIKNEYDQISTGKKDDPMIALRDNIFAMLTNF